VPTQLHRGPSRSSQRRSWLAAALTAVMLVTVNAGTPPTAAASTSSIVTACADVNLRTTASTSGTRKATLKANVAVTVAATVTGSSWKAECAGKIVSGSSWYKISHVNGKTAKSLYGVSYVYGAKGLFKTVTTTSTTTTATLSTELMRLVQADREALGKSELQVDDQLVRLAGAERFTCPSDSSLRPTGRAADMAARNYFAHTIKGCKKPDGTLYRASDIMGIVFGYPSSRTEIIHYNSASTSSVTYKIGCDIAGANCVGGTTTAPKTVVSAQQAFMTSSVHRNVQLGGYDRFGCAAAPQSGTSRTYYACLFAKGGPTTESSPTTTGTPMVTACGDVNVRTSASTTATRKATLKAGVPVTVVGTVSGGSWKTECAGKAVSGSGWHKISHVNGKTVKSLYGVSYVYGATGLFTASTASVEAEGAVAGAVSTNVFEAAAEPTSTTSSIVAACDASARTSAKTSATRKAIIKAGATIRVAATVTGGSWSATCAGKSVSGTAWYKITHINGKTVSSLYGVTYLYAAKGLFKTVTPSIKLTTACGDVSLRTAAKTSATRKAVLKAGVAVTAVGTVSGGSWKTTCAGKSISGSSWYKITHVNGKTAKSLYGVTYVYGAKGLFKAVTTTASPTPTPTPAPTPSPTPTPTPASDPEPSPSPDGTPMPTPTPGASPTPTPTPSPTPTPTPTPSPTPTPTPTPAASPTPTPTPISGVITLGSSVTFHGRGWGHGVGLSQYGARGRAAAGHTYTQILAHYYKDATFGTLSNPTIRVLILDDYAATSTSPLTLYGRDGAFTIDGVTGTFPKDARIRVSGTTASGVTTWRLLVTAADGTVLHDGATTARFRIRPAADATRIQVYSKPSSYDRYRGIIRVYSSGSVVDVVNELPIETYLRGVVPSEMPSSWPTEALKAQTIAARSYAARRIRTTSHFDLYDSTASQVYLGLLGEKASTDAVIAATAGEVLMKGTEIANTVFHSAGGGWTEHNENSFVSSSGAKVAGAVSYLRGRSDRRPDGTAYDDASPYATWKTATYTRSQLSTWFASDSRTNVGSLVKLDLTNRGVSGRLISVTLIGSTGTTKTVSGDVFREVVNVNKPASDPRFRSNLFALVPIP
jgi:stage II sporulation protein D